MKDLKSIVIRQWAWEELNVRVWRSGRWGKEYQRVTPASRARLRSITAADRGYFARQEGALEFCAMSLWCWDYQAPNSEPATIPNVEPADEFFSPNIEPDPLEPYWDYVQTFQDERAATRS